MKKTQAKVKARTARKITVELESDLLDKATGATGLGLTPTIRKGLELIATTDAFEKLLALRGKVKFSINLDKLREDRS